MTKALSSAFHLLAVAVFVGVMASHVQADPGKPIKQQEVATKRSTWKPSKSLGRTRADIEKHTKKSLVVTDAGKNRISIDTSPNGGKAVWYLDFNPINGRVQIVTLKHPNEMSQKELEAFIKAQVPDVDLNDVETMAVPDYVNPYAPSYDKVEAYAIGSKSHKTWYLEKGEKGEIKGGDHYVLLTDLPTATKVARDGDPTSRMTRQVQVDKAKHQPLEAATDATSGKKGESMRLFGKTKAQMDNQFGKPIGEDNGLFRYDTTKQSWDKSQTWTVFVEFNSLSKKVEVAEYDHEVYLEEGQPLSDETKNSIIKANIPNADLDDVQHIHSKRLAFQATGTKDDEVKAFIVQDKKSLKKYYVEIGYFVAEGMDWKQHVDFIYISDSSLAETKAPNN